ncbi:MAG: DNA topoisomerase IB [Sphingosinicella sp.]|uniref:DNA topoisomerase IB n=1 Tax=Sphingosinicella sp. TaxID=1917971 RepID=UPI0040380D4A
MSGPRLCYSDDSAPGISRRRKGRYWQYFAADGKRITDRDEIDRLNAIGLPPAYVDAWFCPKPNGHIQAVGWDEKGRKQYRYHPDFREKQEAVKYDRLRDFARALPKLRRRVRADLRKRKLGRDTVIAAVVRLLDTGCIRIGNEAYARDNKSYGATTLRNRHAKVHGRTLKMRFKAKSGQERELSITDATLSRIVRQCQDLPGQHLFQYVNGDGEPQPVSSTDVNDYIRDIMGEAFTAKHFRTWSASVIAFEQVCESDGEGVGLKAMIEPVAEMLGNTPAIARKSYIHPALVEAAKVRNGKGFAGLKCPRATKYLSSAERGLAAFLAKTGR